MRFGIAAAVLTIAATFTVYRIYHQPPPQSQPALDDGYVNAMACAGCHRGIWDTYRQTGMGRSFRRINAEVAGGDFEKDNTFYHGASDRFYKMYRRDGKYYQRRHQKDSDGSEQNIVEKEIHFIVGSGNHARTYLHRTPEGRLFELPVAWYSEKGGYWAMNPGFDTPRHPDFRRQLMYECVSCHTGYPEIEPGADASGHEPLFPGRIPEGIDCQRCHGPGRNHIQAATGGGKPDSIRVAIVNPKRLAPERQLEVCMQCHLETTSSRLPHTILRFNRGAFSYRPGTPLADFAIHFDHQPGTGHDDKFEIAHQAYRLRKSACFQKSNGRMTCTTCHDPHVAARGEQAVQRYTSVCRSCHTPPHTDANCIECHMPKRRPEDVVNVTMTDHFIQRRPPRRDPAAPLKERQETEDTRYRGEVVLYYPAELGSEDELYLAVAQVKQFNNLKAGIPRLEAALRKFPKAAGEFHFELAEAYGHEGRQEDAVRSYREAIRRKPGFRPAWLGLGRSLSKSGQNREAVEAFEKAAGMGPEDATILNDLGLSYLAEGRTGDALRVLQRAVTVNPDHAEAHNNLANLLASTEQYDQALEQFEAAARVDPNLAEAQLGMADMLALKGQIGQAIWRYRQAILRKPELGAAHLGLASALEAQGLRAEAISHLKKAAQSPDTAAAEAARQALQSLK